MNTVPARELTDHVPAAPGCRVCRAQTSTVLDLGLVPVANHLTADGTAPEHPRVVRGFQFTHLTTRVGTDRVVARAMTDRQTFLNEVVTL